MSEIKKYWEKFKQASGKLKTQLYLGYGVTFAVLSLLIISFLFLGVKQLMMDQIGQSRLDVLKQISERSNTIKNSTITISNLYRYDEEVQRCLSENGLSEEEMEQAGRYLDGVKENYDRVFHDVGVAYDVVILGDNGFRYASRGRDHYDFDGLESQLWYKRSYDAENDIVFISSFREKFDLSSREERYVFAAFRRVAGTDGRETGTILVNVDEKYLEDLYGTAEDRSNLYIFDKKGNIVSSREKSLLGKNFIGVDNFRRLYGENEYHIIKKLGQDYLLSNYYDPQTGWTIVEEMPCAVILQPLNQALVLLLAIVSGCLLAGTGAACYMSERISKPILKLCRLMDRVKQGDFDVISDIRGYEEVNQLKDSFNEMAAEIKKLLEDIRDNEMQKRKSEMDFLRAQINPHFLYNTLFSIQCMIELKKNDQAVLMMAAFTDLLKKTLSVDTDFITLKEEFESTEKYLVLQQIRYGDKIHYECEMGAETEQCLVPALIIQPIVENAIFHGIEAKEEAGLIIVESVVSEGALLITVSDDGVGLDEKELARMTAQFGEREYQSGRSIGILNVLNRIKINFGEGYGLTVESEPGIGTSVTMRLPVVLKEMQGVNHENTDSR
ncbi:MULTISPECIES: sensor histidine kinase [Hungatella]|uniref:histidine kinase n=1 Tax=Hungatella hathewayi TaxID=154046 RepID=A0A3E4U0M5_9FIRM|nr:MULTISPECIES: sensor histidine kinase [Hungatella]RGL98550.1 sensor histidine kinase [Hungatella hathewayi]RGO73136.1 sensor histidine kinase [Hungatella hathewayi]RHM71241.1 sensor histidine kinase [Hungatella hathewayi]